MPTQVEGEAFFLITHNQGDPLSFGQPLLSSMPFAPLFCIIVSFEYLIVPVDQKV